MIYLTDVPSQRKVALNPDHIIAVFVIADGDYVGKTGINLSNGSIVVEEQDFDVVAMINNNG